MVEEDEWIQMAMRDLSLPAVVLMDINCGGREPTLAAAEAEEGDWSEPMRWGSRRRRRSIRVAAAKYLKQRRPISPTTPLAPATSSSPSSAGDDNHRKRKVDEDGGSCSKVVFRESAPLYSKRMKKPSLKELLEENNLALMERANLKKELEQMRKKASQMRRRNEELKASLKAQSAKARKPALDLDLNFPPPEGFNRMTG
ncbi:hypothetical protein QJS10_CPA05g02184 [Acorus calamus]|uniref:Uncharacterized protein n=1 Tax=Acorus calamus TaxID=4465 RepID=A0AAV9ETU0_ACOCL|nr:hypothetical protein QJS10_CPA05g02178 [Acorus calamus]KAK1316576.1 hypothetical protein QJS10_CPA05g02184 [Acorus calamus]